MISHKKAKQLNNLFKGRFKEVQEISQIKQDNTEEIHIMIKFNKLISLTDDEKNNIIIETIRKTYYNYNMEISHYDPCSVIIIYLNELKLKIPDEPIITNIEQVK